MNEEQFKEYSRRYHRLFHTDGTTQVFGALGNHDIGFHYRLVFHCEIGRLMNALGIVKQSDKIQLLTQLCLRSC